MTYLLSNAEQLRVFLYACGFGFFLGAVYTLFRFFRVLLQDGARAYTVSDFLFSLCAGILIFLFSLSVLNGKLRGYVFFGILLGFLLYLYTFGAVLGRCFEHTARRLRQKFYRFFGWLLRRFRKFSERLRRIFTKNVQKAQKKAKISVKKSNLHLKNIKDVVYNQNDKVSNRRGNSVRGKRGGRRIEGKTEKETKA